MLQIAFCSNKVPKHVGHFIGTKGNFTTKTNASRALY